MNHKATIPRGMLKNFIEASHEVGRHGLTRCSSGNLSCRLDRERMLITASRSWKGELTPGQVCVCRISDGKALDGKNPSVEAGFHAGILRVRPEMNVVLHFQAPCATTLACIPRRRINHFMIPEVPFYIGPIARVPFLLPGSRELAEAVTNAMCKHDMVLLENHGQVTVARDFEHAIQNAEFLELACEAIVLGGRAVSPIPERYARKLLSLRKQVARRAV